MADQTVVVRTPMTYDEVEDSVQRLGYADVKLPRNPGTPELIRCLDWADRNEDRIVILTRDGHLYTGSVRDLDAGSATVTVTVYLD